MNSGIQPIQNLRVMQRLKGEFGIDAEQARAWSRGWIEEGFVALEALVAQYGGTCCVGDAVSFADLCLVPQLYNARRFEVDLSRFPRLTAIEQRLEALPAFADAHPHLLSKSLLRLYYTEERALSPAAKERFVEPDLAPLPPPPS